MIVVFFRHWSVASIPFIGRLSGWVSGWEYSHVGLWFPGDDHIYDATMRHDVARQPYDQWMGEHPERVLAIVIRGCDAALIRQWLDRQIGRYYDWKAILLDKVYNITKAQNPQWWFCSELIYEALRQGGCLQSRRPTNLIMPRDLFTMIAPVQQFSLA